MPTRYLLTLTVKGRMMAYMSETAITTHQGQIPAWTLGWKLKRALDHAGLSAQEMAAELGVHVGTVSRWMNDRETPRRAYVMAWALRCGVAFSWLAETDEPVTNPDIPSGISASGGYTPIDNDITRSRKRIAQRLPLRGPVLSFLFGAAA